MYEITSKLLRALVFALIGGVVLIALLSLAPRSFVPLTFILLCILIGMVCSILERWCPRGSGRALLLGLGATISYMLVHYGYFPPERFLTFSGSAPSRLLPIGIEIAAIFLGYWIMRTGLLLLKRNAHAKA